MYALTLDFEQNEQVISKCSFTPEERERIAEENYSLIHYVARSYVQSGVSYEELVGAATIGFVKALNAYSYEKDAKFSTFAINCMKNEVLLLLRKELKHQRHCVSMDTVLSKSSKNGRDLTLEDVICTEEGSMDDQLVFEEEKELLLKVIEQLSEKEKYILMHRYGLCGVTVKTQKEVAKEVGMSQANVSKVERSIVKRVRVLVNKEKKLRSFYGT